MKQKFFDFNLIKAEWNIFSIISAVTGFVLAITGVPSNFNIAILIGFIILFAIIYIILFCYYKFWCNHIEFKIGKVNLNIKIGDIFKENGMKVIPVNEYFDTQVDNIIISQNTLHGMYVKEYLKYNDLDSLNSKIEECLKGCKYEENEKRLNGKKKRYAIGTTININDYILTALTKFDNNNKAYLSMQEYLKFLNDFWNEINRIHNGRIINVPIIGTGISRINPVLSEQEFLEQIIWSLKTSSLITSKSKINIIVYTGDKEKISFSEIKNRLKK